MPSINVEFTGDEFAKLNVARVHAGKSWRDFVLDLAGSICHAEGCTNRRVIFAFLPEPPEGVAIGKEVDYNLCFECNAKLGKVTAWAAANYREVV